MDLTDDAFMNITKAKPKTGKANQYRMIDGRPFKSRVSDSTITRDDKGISLKDKFRLTNLRASCFED